MSDVVGRLWGFCQTLRHEGVDYGDYIEQITYLLFIKMADERSVELPSGCDWPTLTGKSGTELLDHYIDTLRTLGKQPGLLGSIFAESQSRFGNPVSLKKLLNLIDETQWTELDVDVKAAAFEGLLEKAASEGKKGAGQYFTPRIVIDAVVACMKPDPRSHKPMAIGDPACGTGGFLVGAYEWLIDQTKGAVPRELVKRLRTETYFGQDLVARPRRLALMNLFLHGLEPKIGVGDSIYDPPTSQRFDVILTNPPFGVKGAKDVPSRDDFTVSTTNKQLNFVQHVLTTLRDGGRAAIVLPDSCLFAEQASQVLRILTEDCDLHTIVRLPNGTFTPYSPDTKTNVLFFRKGLPTEKTWIFDARTNVPKITKAERPLTEAHLEEFVACYGDDPNGHAARSEDDSPEGRWRVFDITEIKRLEFKLDGLRWIEDRSFAEDDESLSAEELATTALAEVEVAVEELRGLLAILEGDEAA